MSIYTHASNELTSKPHHLTNRCVFRSRRMGWSKFAFFYCSI